MAHKKDNDTACDVQYDDNGNLIETITRKDRAGNLLYSITQLMGFRKVKPVRSGTIKRNGPK